MLQLNLKEVDGIIILLFFRQKLFLLNEKNPVILNTYFSQKVVAKEPTEKERPDFQEPLFTKRSISLAWIFHLSAIKDSSPQVSAINQTSCPDMKTSKTVYTHTNQESKLSPFAVSSLSESLLDIVEAQGTAEGRAIQVQVVVQRVYYLIAKDLRCHLQEDNLSQNTSPLLNSDQPNIRLQQYVDRELPEVQAGFRRGRGTRDQIANIRWIMEKARESQKNIYFCFIDYAKAFDCVDHNKLWQVLKEMGVPDHLI
ncbi:DNA repair-scaffolding protein [Varanus komodoensis]|nr:DNA repair-scaffolding protein [Varanus komodoensis]